MGQSPQAKGASVNTAFPPKSISFMCEVCPWLPKHFTGAPAKGRLAIMLGSCRELVVEVIEMKKAIVVLLLLSLLALPACYQTESTESVAPFPSNGCEADLAVSQYLLDLAQGHTHEMHLWAEYNDKAGIQAGYYGDYEAGYKHDGWQIIHIIEEWDVDGSDYLQDVFEGVEPLELHDGFTGWLLEWYVYTDGSVQPWNSNAVRLEAELQRNY